MPASIQRELLSLADIPYKQFQGALIPTMPAERMIGVRMPHLRKIAKKIQGSTKECIFLGILPHAYHEEDLLHALLLCEMQDFTACIAQTERFLPYISNWAICDSLRPKCFLQHKKELLPYLRKWLSSSHTYTVRFAIEMLMMHFLDEDYDEAFPLAVTSVQSEDYYVNMMIAWYFATALAKQRETVLPYFTSSLLPPDVRKKAIRKALESYRIDTETKLFLKTLT